MRRQTSTVRFDGPALAAAILCCALLGTGRDAHADVPSYEATVPLAGPTEEERAQALAAALQVVVVKASGRREAATSGPVAAAKPARYVQRYTKTADQRLKVGFDGRLLEELLQQAGLPLWPSERPLTVVLADVADRAALERVAEGRGLPIAWGEAGRAGATAVLTGTPDAGGYAWTFSHAGRTARLRGSADDGIHLAADTLASLYAPPSTRGLTNLDVRIGGIGDVAAYAGLTNYLRTLSLVRDVTVQGLDGDVLRLRLATRGDLDLLAWIAALDGRLAAPADAGGVAAAGPEFVYRP